MMYNSRAVCVCANMPSCEIKDMQRLVLPDPQLDVDSGKSTM